MQKSLILIAGFVLFFMLSLSTVFAQISISDVNDIYNLGDKVNLNLDITPKDNQGKFEINLICDGEKVNIERLSAEPRFSVGEQTSYNTFVRLTKEYIGNLTGSCYFEAIVVAESAVTNTFKISNYVELTASLDKKEYKPGEIITLTVDAVKENGNLLDGFVEASNATDFAKEIVKGKLVEKFAMSENAESGNYELDLYVYDAGHLNTAEESLSFKIKQIPSSVVIALASLEANPGESFDIGVDVYDQSGKVISGVPVSVLLISPSLKERQITINSGNFDKVNLALNDEKGAWNILAQYNDIYDDKEIEVLGIQKVEFEFEESVLIVRNVGNDYYNQSIEINFGDEKRNLDLNIEVGGERRFNLKAPNGEYLVSVRSGEQVAEKSLLLTGRVVDVRDAAGGGFLSRYPVVWIFIIVIIAAIALVFFFRYRKRTFKLKGNKKFESAMKENTIEEEKGYLTHDDKKSEAVTSLVMNGNKEEASVVAVKINNLAGMGEVAKKEVIRIFSEVKEMKGMTEFKDDSVMIIFSTLITKTFKNELLAVKATTEVMKKINAHNKKFKDKIEISIGVNAGQIISSVENKKLKYTGVGSTIVLAKRLASSDVAKKKIIISENVRKRMMRDVKVEKVGEVSGHLIYEVKELTDREANKEKLHDILERMKREGSA